MNCACIPFDLENVRLQLLLNTVILFHLRYVQEDLLRPGDAHYRQFHKIFEAFKLTEPEKKPDVEQSPVELAAKSVEGRKKVVQQMEDSDDEVRKE